MAWQWLLSISLVIKLNFPFIERKLELPKGVSAEVDGKIVRMTGPKGSLTRDFGHTPVEVTKEGDTVLVITARNLKRSELSIVGTVQAHLRNMAKGVTTGHVYRLKMAYAHFPMNVKVVNDTTMIENFIGERAPRRAHVQGGVEVRVDGDDIVVSGVDKENVSQTAANIQRATRIRAYDRRVFSDGIFVYQKE